MAAKLECPECRAAMGGNDFQCTHCGLLLDPQQASGEYVITEPTRIAPAIDMPVSGFGPIMPSMISAEPTSVAAIRPKRRLGIAAF